MNPFVVPETKISVQLGYSALLVTVTGVGLMYHVCPFKMRLLPTGFPLGLSKTATSQVIVRSTKPLGIARPGILPQTSLLRLIVPKPPDSKISYSSTSLASCVGKVTV